MTFFGSVTSVVMAEGGYDAKNVRHVPMATLANIEPFDDNLEDITSYVERLDQFSWLTS